MHGDDFITVGNRKNIRWFKNKLEGRFEIKTKIIGQGEGEDREARVLNRIIHVTLEGWEYEPDQRHADILIQAMNLSGAKGVKAPGKDEKNWEMSENDQAVDPKEETHFRALAARANYLALDRMDLQYATKEVCRGMAAPTRGHVKKLTRLIRYLIEVPRVVTEYKFQGDVREMEVFSDSNWAGCRRTARSTSGGVMMRGTHYLKSWSSTQKNVTLSSAEAELLAAVKASGEALGMLQLMSSVGVPMTASIMVDSSAALAVVARKGNGKLRHVRVGHLWVQQVANDGGLKYHKVNGEENPSDACTKHLAGERLRKLVARVGQCQRSGRAQESLRVQPARTAPADSPGCLKHQGEGECQHISTPSTGLSPGCDPVAVYCAKTSARLQDKQPKG